MNEVVTAIHYYTLAAAEAYCAGYQRRHPDIQLTIRKVWRPEYQRHVWRVEHPETAP